MTSHNIPLADWGISNRPLDTCLSRAIFSPSWNDTTFALCINVFQRFRYSSCLGNSIHLVSVVQVNHYVACIRLIHELICACIHCDRPCYLMLSRVYCLHVDFDKPYPARAVFQVAALPKVISLTLFTTFDKSNWSWRLRVLTRSELLSVVWIRLLFLLVSERVSFSGVASRDQNFWIEKFKNMFRILTFFTEKRLRAAAAPPGTHHFLGFPAPPTPTSRVFASNRMSYYVLSMVRWKLRPSRWWAKS